MDKKNETPKSQIHDALYQICSTDGHANSIEESLNRLNSSSDRDIIKSLLTIIMNEDEESFVRKYASTFLIRCIERVNALVPPIMRVFFNALNGPERRNSMRKGFYLLVEIVADTMQDCQQDYCRFIVNLTMKYLRTENETELHELGAIMLHALLKHMPKQMMPHAKDIAEGIQIIVKTGRSSLEKDAESAQTLYYHTLMCAKILGQQLSKDSTVVPAYWNSLEDIFEILKLFAAHSNAKYFNDVAEILKVLLRNKLFTGLKWSHALKTCEWICRSKQSQDFARIKALEILEYVIHVRGYFLERPNVFQNLLHTVMLTLSQEPAEKPNGAFEESMPDVPTPESVATDLLLVITKKYRKEQVSYAYVRILHKTAKYRAINEWQFRGFFITLARIARKCGRYLNVKYAKELAIVFQAGFIDVSRHVSQAAVYALHKLFTSLRNTAACYRQWVRQIFPAFLKNFEYLLCDCKCGSPPHRLHVERLYASAKIFHKILDLDMLPHLHEIVNISQDILSYLDDNRIVILTIELLQETVCHLGIAFVPYFSTLIVSLEPFLIGWDKPEYDEIRPCIVDLLARIAKYSLPNVIEIGENMIIELIIFDLLQIQHARTQHHGADLDYLLKYSPLRCSIFRFFQEICNKSPDKIQKYLPKIVSTLLGTVTAVKFIPADYLKHVVVSQYRLHFLPVAAVDPPVNRTIEAVQYSLVNDSYTLFDEVCQALIALQHMTENCVVVMLPYIEEIFLRLCETLQHAYAELRKEILYTLNSMMMSFFRGFQFDEPNFIDLCAIEVAGLIDMYADYAIIGECVRCFLCYVAIKEKFHQPNPETHVNILTLLAEIFQTVASLPQSGTRRRDKDVLLNEIIAFMPRLATMCPPERFNSYLNVYLIVFEAKLNMPLYRSPMSDQRRVIAYEKLIEGFQLMDKNDTRNFKEIAELFLKGLNDPMSLMRENAAAGLGMLVNHCNPQPVQVYKYILHRLWKLSRREKHGIVLDCICYAMVMTVNRNIWQQRIHMLSMQITRLLPIRHIFDYNMIMVEFFERLCNERPAELAHIIKDIYKFLLELLKDDMKTDIDPLYKRALALAASLYTKHIEELRQISINPITMQAILAACKNRACLRAILR